MEESKQEEVNTNSINVNLFSNDYKKLEEIANYYHQPIEKEFSILSSAFINTYYEKMPKEEKGTIENE